MLTAEPSQHLRASHLLPDLPAIHDASDFPDTNNQTISPLPLEFLPLQHPLSLTCYASVIAPRPICISQPFTSSRE